jgi:hypothetical protein
MASRCGHVKDLCVGSIKGEEFLDDLTNLVSQDGFCCSKLGCLTTL